MSRMALAIACGALATPVAVTATHAAEPFTLDPVLVIGREVHPSQQIRTEVDRAFNSNRSVSEVDGSVIQNTNPINKGAAVRYNTTGLISQPGTGDRFGGGTKIRTFGDFGAATSIDGLPAFKSQGEEGGGYSNTIVPSIAVDRVSVMKGGRAVQYGDGTDGGVLETRIKSGRDYKNHQALSLDGSTAREGILQGEAADSSERWDYYAAGSGFYGHYDGDPENLDEQRDIGGLGKVGWNIGADTRLEFLAIYDRSEPAIIRNGNVEDISSEGAVGSATVDHRLSDTNSLRGGLLLTDSHSTWSARSRDRSLSNQIGFAEHLLAVPLTESIAYDGSIGAEVKRTNMQRDNQWDNTFDDHALISRNALTFDNNLIVTGGLRHTWFNNDVNFQGATQPDNLQTDSLWSSQFGASYSVLEKTRVRASYANGYNRFFEKYGNFGTDPLNPAGAGDEIVQSRTVEVGVNQGWTGGHIDVALYNIVQDNVPRRSNGAIENVEVDQSGLEVEVFHRLTDSLSLSAGYMYLFALEATRADGSSANTNIFFNGGNASVPEHQMSLRVDYRVTEDIGLWGAAYHSTGYEAVDANDNVTKRDGFTRLDLGAGWWVTPKWALRFRVENLLDERDFGQTVSGLPTDDDAKLGRVFWLGVDHTF